MQPCFGDITQNSQIFVGLLDIFLIVRTPICGCPDNSLYLSFSGPVWLSEMATMNDFSWHIYH